MTWQVRFSARSPSIAAESSIRLLVASGTPPCNTRSCSPYRRMHAQPPGPGFPRHEPSMIISTSLRSQAETVDKQHLLSRSRLYSLRWSARPAHAAAVVVHVSEQNLQLPISYCVRTNRIPGGHRPPVDRALHATEVGLVTDKRGHIRLSTDNCLRSLPRRLAPRRHHEPQRRRYIRRGSAHRALATCARGAPPTHKCRGIQPEPVIVR